ncbi:MAG: ABC transporter substrate-binding protein [Rhodobacterales bacterium]|nr:ABC transporter substrate-binding protein [Rhodobacterales bacterium]
MGLPYHVLVLATALAVGFVAPASAEKVFRQANDLSLGGAEDLDPLSRNTWITPVSMIYSRLMREGANGEASPELATSWTANADATEWTLTLQPGVTFHDGSEFDAADVAYSLGRIEDPVLESPVAAVLGIIDRVEVVDPMTVRIILEAPHAGLPLLLLDYRVRIIPEGSGETIVANPVGTGPFRIETFDPEGTTTLVAYDGYWEGRPLLDKIQFNAIPDAEARNQAMLAGQLDYNGLTADQAPLFADNPAFQVQAFPSGAWNGLVLRTDTAPFDDPRVRRALRIAVDREAMLNLLEGPQGGVVGCDTPVNASDPFRANLNCPQDIEGAKALLAEAGYPDGIDIELFTSDVSPGMVRFAEVYQAQVAPAGIRVAITLSPSDGYWSDVWMKEPAVITSWDNRPADQFLNEIFRSGVPNNETFYANPEFDALLDQARSTVDMAAARDLYVRAQQIIYDDGGVLIPFLKNGRRVLSANVTGIPVNKEEFIRWHLVDLAQ